MKIIYVTRNPRDACVSYHNHWKILEGYHGGFEAFAEAFISDIAGYYSPFIHHVLGKMSAKPLFTPIFSILLGVYSYQFMHKFS